MNSIISPGSRKCAPPSQGGCGQLRAVGDFIPKRDADTDEVVGYRSVCKECNRRKWEARRDGKPRPDLTLTVDGEPTAIVGSALFRDRSEEALAYIKTNRSLQGCADYIGVSLATLEKWLTDPRDAYQDWARKFRLARDTAHRQPLVEEMTRLALKEGSERAIEFLLKTGWRKEFGDRKDMDLTVSQGAPQIDESQYSLEELVQLRNLLAKGSE